MSVLFGEEGKTKEAAKPRVAFRERQLFPVMTAEKLLSGVQHQRLLKDITAIVTLPPKHYKALYQDLIDNFAEFVQVLPVSNRGVLGGLLHEALRRGLYSLEAYQQEGAKLHPLWNYVLFTAGLLFDIAKVAEQRTVMISSRQGAFIKHWQPLDESLADAGDYYKIRRGGGVPPWLARRMTPMLARQLMPEVGFKWLASNPRALSVWLALLSDESASAGGFRRILNRAHELIVELKAGQEFAQTVDIEKLETPDTDLGEDFVEWLKDGIEDGSIPVNESDAHVFMVDEGLFLEMPEIFKDYSNYDRSASDWRVVYQQFNELGFAPLSGEDYHFQQYFAEHADVKSAKAGSASTQGQGKPATTKTGAEAGKAAAAKTATKVEGVKADTMFGVKPAASVSQNLAETRGTFQTSTHIKNGSVVPAGLASALTGDRAVAVDNNMSAAEARGADPLPKVDAAAVAAASANYSSR